jgi:YaiO family outer membrane protein
MRKLIIVPVVLLIGLFVQWGEAAFQSDMNQEFKRGLELKRSEKFMEAAKIFSKIVEMDPKNVDALEQLATLYGWLGRYEDSIFLWKKALAFNHSNIDYRFALARVLSWKGDIQQAKEEYLRVHAVKKNDFDVLMGLGDVEMSLKNVTEARKYYLLAQSVRPNDPTLKKRLAGAVLPLLWRVDAGFSYDGYRNNISSRIAEHNSYTQIGRKFEFVSSSLWMRHEWQNHFGRTDNTIYVGGALRPVKFLAAQLEAGFTATPNFQPTQQYGTVIDFPISRYFIPSLGLKYLNYREGNVNLYSPGFKVQPMAWLDLNYRLTYAKNLSGPDSQGWLTQMNFQLGEKAGVYLGYSEGNESLPPLELSFNQTLFSGISLQISKRLAWRVDYSYENRPGLRGFLRSSIGSGFTVKF